MAERIRARITNASEFSHIVDKFSKAIADVNKESASLSGVIDSIVKTLSVENNLGDIVADGSMSEAIRDAFEDTFEGTEIVNLFIEKHKQIINSPHYEKIKTILQHIENNKKNYQNLHDNIVNHTNKCYREINKILIEVDARSEGISEQPIERLKPGHFAN